MPTPEWLAPLFDYEGELHKKVISQIQAMGNAAASKNESRHAEWNRAERLYQLYVDPRGETNKKGNQKNAHYGDEIRVPVVRAMMDANVTQWWLPWAQRDPIAPFRGRGPEDYVPAFLMCVHIDWQIRQRKMMMSLHALMQSIAKYGIGIAQIEWIEDDRRRSVIGPDGRVTRAVRNHYTGNILRVIDPYRWLTDPGLPSCDFQDGEFASHSFEASHVEVVRRQRRDGWINEEYMKSDMGRPQLSKRYPFLFGSASNASERNRSMGVPENDDELERYAGYAGSSRSPRPSSHILTVWEQQVIPDEIRSMAKECGYKNLPDELGSMDPEIWRFHILNGCMIVDIEPTTQTSFGFQVGEITPDMLSRFTKGKVELLADLNDYLDFLYNSRIEAVHRGIFPDEIYHPMAIDQDLWDRPGAGRRVPLRADAWAMGMPIDQMVHRLPPISDLTQSHAQDAPLIIDLMRDLSGVSKQALGQVSTGRRAASDVSIAAQQGAARFDTELRILNDECIYPIFGQMAENTQLFETVERWFAITGKTEEMLRRSKRQTAPPLMSALGENFDPETGQVSIGPADLQGDFDFEVMDGNPQVVDVQKAQSAIQAMQVATGIPGFWEEYDPMFMMRQVFGWLGVRNLFEADMRRVADVPTMVENRAAAEADAEQLASLADAGDLQPVPEY